MTDRIRLVAVNVQPVYVIDNGDTLEPAPDVQPFTVPSTQWPDVVALVADGTERLQAKLDSDGEDDA